MAFQGLKPMTLLKPGTLLHKHVLTDQRLAVCLEYARSQCLISHCIILKTYKSSTSKFPCLVLCIVKAYTHMAMDSIKNEVWRVI